MPNRASAPSAHRTGRINSLRRTNCPPAAVAYQLHPRAWSKWALAKSLDPAGFVEGRQFDHLPLMLEGAAAGLGVAIAPEFLIEREIFSQRLIAPLGFVPCGAFFAFCTMSNRQDEELTKLRDWVKSETIKASPSPTL